MKIHQLRKCIRRTLLELANEISVTNPDQGRAIRTILDSHSDKGLMKELASGNSELVQNIPIDVLSSNAGGIQYLNVLSIVQPLFQNATPVPAARSSSTVAEQSTALTLPTNLPGNPFAGMESQIEALLGNEELVNLAKQMVEDLKLDPKNLNVSDMFGLIGQIQQYLVEKNQKGELDLSRIESQCTTLGEQFVNGPQGRQFLEKCKLDPAMMESVMGMMQTSAPAEEDPATQLLNQLG